MTGIGPCAAPTADRPWKRPGALRYALERLRGIAAPPVRVFAPVTGSVQVDRDVPITVRDGTVLRANVHLPPGCGPFPVLVCAHPYGKDNLPRHTRRGYRFSFQYRVLRQTSPVRFSTLTSWEAPDPAWWTAHGYAVVNADLRGAGTSGGTGDILSVQEGRDVHDVVEWAAAQPWSSGRIGMLGVSYLAISQWEAAAQRPPQLAAIVPWEGMTDPYRDLLRPGGIAEQGFVKLWSRGLRTNRLTYSLGERSGQHPLRDGYWRSVTPELSRIDVPALICASFSDNNLHSRGSFRGFEGIGSADKHIYTHRSGKWATFYSDEARRVQLAFLDRHVRGRETAALPPVHLEVRESRDVIAEVRAEAAWPLPSTRWTELTFDSSGSFAFDMRTGGMRVGWTMPEDIEITGPMALRLFVSVADGDDVDLYAGVEKWRGTAYVPFEGSYGFGRDRVSTGWMRASMRRLDDAASRTFDPVPTYRRREPLRPGDIVQVDIPMGPSATLFRAGEQLRLVVAGRWLWPRNPLTGQFPAAYEKGPRGTCTLHWGPDHPARLLIPVIPEPDRRRRH